ncbi:hypothetical protein D3C80_2097640 [compost metagenome]
MLIHLRIKAWGPGSPHGSQTQAVNLQQHVLNSGEDGAIFLQLNDSCLIHWRYSHGNDDRRAKRLVLG